MTSVKETAGNSGFYGSAKGIVARLAAVLVVFCLVLSGCGTVKDKISVNNPASGDSITVQDSWGRTVKVPANIRRIVCLCPEAGHAVVMMGQGDKVVGVVEGLKRDVLLNRLCPSIQKALVPRTSGKINIEELIQCKPDLIFIKGETARDRGELKKLDKIGIPYLIIEYKSMKEQQRAIETIGKAVGNVQKAQKYISYYNNVLERVGRRISRIPENQRVRVYHSINEATRTDVRGTLSADWLKAAGAQNVSVNQQLRLFEGKNYASLEQILLWDPDVILVNEPGVGDYIMSNPQWASLKAVKNHRVIQMPIGISRWGHPSSLETPLVILWTAKILYPHMFSDVNMVKEIQYFYREFFGYAVSEQTARQILSGEGMREPKQ